MKKVLTALALMVMTLGVSVAQENQTPVSKSSTVDKPAYSYEEFAKIHPDIKKFQDHPEFVFDSVTTPEKLKEMDYYPDDKIKKNDKYDFYIYIKPNPKIYGVELLSKTIVVRKSNNKIVGFLAHYRGEKSKIDLEKSFNQKYGVPIVSIQKDLDLFEVWGFENKNKDKSVNSKEKINSIVVAYNIYTGLGSLIWNTPSAEFTQN